MKLYTNTSGQRDIKYLGQILPFTEHVLWIKRGLSPAVDYYGLTITIMMRMMMMIMIHPSAAIYPVNAWIYSQAVGMQPIPLSMVVVYKILYIKTKGG